MPIVPAARDKYYLRTLHQEIGLFDRKLAHLLKYETFNTEEDRQAAAGKLATKRETLARTARQLAEEGIEFKPSELPISFRPDDYVEEAPAVEPEAEQLAAVPAKSVSFTPDHRAYDFGQEIRAYLQQRKKA
jgi:hypothetical protein